MDHASPEDALKNYRRQSPDFVINQAEAFKKLPVQDALELLFYMSVHQANAMAGIAERVDMEITEMPATKDN